MVNFGFKRAFGHVVLHDVESHVPQDCEVIGGFKHGASYRCQWRKVHLGIDAETLEIRVIEVTTNAIGDALVLPDLLAQIHAGEKISSAGGDSAYEIRKCHAASAFDRQKTELKVRAEILNLFSQIEMPNTVRVA
jgi:hypothetical protein